MLDVATGTGRLPVALLGDARFTGRVIGLDLSVGMLRKAGERLARFGGRSVLLHQRAEPLPFPDGTFDVVSCLESVELLADREAHFSEFLRVMKPGGILLVTRNTGEWGRAGASARPNGLRISCARRDSSGSRSALVGALRPRLGRKPAAGNAQGQRRPTAGPKDRQTV